MDKIDIFANAKINLTLDVLGKREDGYHAVKMIMQSVSLFDSVNIRKKGGGIFVKTNLKYLPTDSRNIAFAAAKLFSDRANIKEGIEINIKKTIPVAAGLAGGSTDAAAVLVGLNRLYDSIFSAEQLLEMGAELGSDVPFCIQGGCALCEGRGEIMTPLPDLPTTTFVIAKPPFHVSTAWVYSNLKADKLREHPDTNGALEAIRAGDSTGVGIRMFNVLESVTAAAHPEIGKIKRILLECGATGSVMSGSGPTVIGMFKDRSVANDAKNLLRKERCEAFVVHTLKRNEVI